MNAGTKSCVGVLGAGQLALMLAQAAVALDVDVICAGQPGDCAEQAARVLPVDLKSASAVARFAAHTDVVTIESENIDAAVLRGLNLFPNQKAIGIAQDRLLEKSFFAQCGIAVAPFAPVANLPELEGALRTIGVPSILKTRRMGYDGKGQSRLASIEDAASAWKANSGQPCTLEGMVAFDDEVSLLAARGRSGETAFYPLVHNVHREGILRVSTAPFVAPKLQALAEEYVEALLVKLDYVGVLAVEFFVVGDTLLANEMAPRVHNSGHWTIEGSATSQFEQHLRAILGMPLGSTASKPTVMFNCIGEMPSIEETSLFPALFRHDYGKEPRPRRKLGHLTCAAEEIDTVAFWRQRLG